MLLLILADIMIHGCVSVVEHQPSDWFGVDEGSVCHDLHPGLHLFGRVSAEIICPHVGVSGLAESVETEREKMSRR